ncbi:hypothetical protein [Micromonospora kangleipakensis]|uniref:hypothetical protein n=1 Tax=Micromonospora kangleipakensis TaxID=1077942 RepID=UPI001029666F|nr:hypothetical protein [Micromonospora kangleipakensis]
MDDETILRLSHRQILTLGAALDHYMDYWERHAAADGYGSHSPKQLEDLRQHVGELIWVLEVAAAPSGARLQHSPRARQPRSAD